MAIEWMRFRSAWPKSRVILFAMDRILVYDSRSQGRVGLLSGRSA